MLQTTLALIIFLFPLAYSPGPGNLFFAANGARFGLRATLPANFGYHLATLVVTAAIGLGLSTTLATSPRLFMALRITGSAYVLWIAWKLWRAGMSDAATARPAGFVDGVVLLVLNPKAYIIIALMFTQFLGQTQSTSAIALITLVFTANNCVAFLVWTALGDRIARAFSSPNSAQRLNRLFGAVLAAVALWMLLS